MTRALTRPHTRARLMPAWAAPAILLAALLLAATLSGCAWVHPQIVEPTTLSMDEPVETSVLQVYVQPATPPARVPIKALFFPMRVREELSHLRTIGTETMRQVWQIWTAQQVFDVQYFNETLTYYYPTQAIATARKAGADLAVTGEIGFWLHGATSADSSISLRVDIYDVASGQMIWSMAQAGRMEYYMDEDYIFATLKYRMPQDPMYAILCRIAGEMAMTVRAWSGGAQGPVMPAQAASPRQVAAGGTAPTTQP